MIENQSSLRSVFISITEIGSRVSRSPTTWLACAEWPVVASSVPSLYATDLCVEENTQKVLLTKATLTLEKATEIFQGTEAVAK